jgi:hypothetical protein
MGSACDLGVSAVGLHGYLHRSAGHASKISRTISPLIPTCSLEDHPNSVRVMEIENERTIRQDFVKLPDRGTHGALAFKGLRAGLKIGKTTPTVKNIYRLTKKSGRRFCKCRIGLSALFLHDFAGLRHPACL